MKFYNRESELFELQNKLDQKGFDLIVFSGRRRVGKTELIKNLKNIDLYFYITEESSNSLLKQFNIQLQDKFDEEYLNITNWHDFFKYLMIKSKQTKLSIVFDEFQNFEKGVPEFFSIFQKYLEDIARENYNLKFIVLGSYINMIKRIFNHSGSALYGRKTGEMILKPLEFKYIKQILKDNHNIEDNIKLIEIYSLFAGIPRYYFLAQNYKLSSYKDILNKMIFLNLSALKGEVREVFFENVLNVKKEYISIIKAISLGFNTNGKISDYTGILTTTLPKYLEELENTYEIIERIIPVTANKLKSKKGIYKIKDNFLLFWFRFVEKYISYYEFGNYEFIKKKINEEYNDFVGKNTFEDLAKMYIQRKYPQNLTGSWWAGQEEIDICSYNIKNEFILGEVKWTNKKVGFELYNGLLEKIKILNPKSITKIYLFSKSGFEFSLIEKSRELNIELVDLNKLVTFLCK